MQEGTLTSKHRSLGDHSIKTQTVMRSLYYYTLNPDDNFPENAIRCGEHRDWGTITFLIQDMIGGLEVKTTDGQWISAVPIENAILLNSEQLMEYWTGGHFRAALHRVKIITEGREAHNPRQSLVYFISPDGDANIFPVVPTLPEKEVYFRKFNNRPVNAYDHFQRQLEASTQY
ncbi:Scopoletin 8-hydroxylase [Pseudolycoriella hygida]|uniref:Scopoletin 8-hydroxylase n=1 Tax=Pseudolycoriella hygida TaxID=35572 RepID=A0A9Q0MK85_9DIPT|nr:Scopoletin 8-hydroxylase [Pseudolycoriella hygida]